MPINWVEIPWMAVGLLAALSFVSSLIGNSLIRNAFFGSILAVIIFVAFFVFWNYYPTPLQQMVPAIKFPTRV
jgi:hypothetical protein